MLTVAQSYSPKPMSNSAPYTKRRNLQGSNVCVVGGAGFLGSHLVNHLIEERACNVYVLDNLCVGRKKFVHPDAKFIHHDITRSEGFMNKLFLMHDIQFVFNHAAWPYIPDSFERPGATCDVNFMGALNVMNAANEAGCEGILQVSSAEIYGDCEGKINERGIVSPHSTYGASKAAVDAMVQVRWKEAKVPAIALRQFNCVGERETHPYIVPEIISQLDKSHMLRLGNNSVRDFQYAGDAVKMATQLLEYGNFGEVYNMGSEHCIHIYDLASMIGEVMAINEVLIKPQKSRKRPWEIWHLQSDNTKLYNTIPGRPEVSLKEALEKTVTYFLDSNGEWGF